MEEKYMPSFTIFFFFFVISLCKEDESRVLFKEDESRVLFVQLLNYYFQISEPLFPWKREFHKTYGPNSANP